MTDEAKRVAALTAQFEEWTQVARYWLRNGEWQIRRFDRDGVTIAFGKHSTTMAREYATQYTGTVEELAGRVAESAGATLAAGFAVTWEVR